MAARPKTRAPGVSETDSPEVVAMDYRDHMRTYAGFMHLVKWSCIHLFFLVVALYFFIVAGQGWSGALFLLIAVGILVYGIASIGKAAREAEDPALVAATSDL